MATYRGVFACGHEESISITGKGQSEKFKWMLNDECPKCKEKRRKEKYDKENAKAIEESKAIEFPSLIGTEKQIAWASKIRLDHYKRIQSYLERIEESKLKNKTLYREVSKNLFDNPNAAYWIECNESLKAYDIDTFINDCKDKIDTLTGEDIKIRNLMEQVGLKPMEYRNKNTLAYAEKMRYRTFRRFKKYYEKYIPEEEQKVGCAFLYHLFSTQAVEDWINVRTTFDTMNFYDFKNQYDSFKEKYQD